MNQKQLKVQEAREKLQLTILERLKPNTYSEESVIWCVTEKALNKLSLRELESLNLVMMCKIDKKGD